MQTLRAMTVLDVSDVAASVGFYGTLGFASHGIWADPPQFAIVQRGNVTFALALKGRDKPLPLNRYWAAYVYVSDVEAMHRECQFAGIPVTEIRHPEDYGCDDFDILDPDGHRIAFGQARDPNPGPGLQRDNGKG